MNTYKKWRGQVVGVNKKVPLSNNRLSTYVNFDNAATTPPFKSVIERITEFAGWYSSIHRGKGYKSRLCSTIYEEARGDILNFVKADPDYYTPIYVKNTTEAINKLAYTLGQDTDNRNIIITTSMEHHSNDLPWRKYFKVEYIKLNEKGQLSLDDLESKLIKHRGKVRLVTVGGASNVTGYLNPIYQIAGLAHKYGTEVMIDGAQLIPHHPVEMSPKKAGERLDYLAFSGHKMYAPFGTGVLIAPQKTFASNTPDQVGGGTVDIVTPDFVRWHTPPHKEEAGSPNLMGIVALTEAIKILNEFGMESILNHEKRLTDYTLKRLNKIPDVILYGNKFNSKDRLGIIPFNIDGLSHESIATILAGEGGIAVRNGCFCAQPYVQQLLNISEQEIRARINNPDLPHPGLIRISFGLYNTFQEIDRLIDMVKVIVSNKEYYYRKTKINF
ncbi:aminotransferase class V-fold PLP-dependent enzyme [Halothermothrix orenii]|uniref:Cysteine desulfurase n=1 Tax=Halothermothrix orenii (strain H 168 / OCM 544 / DSM 9562) TaxID=373903 RepID=B8CZM9_HALOH|nr:aminotransferase class V-fold PLP-dependent enzyme [Halothermothrix orenii]ACL70748.1 Cysteine desulfurase [Halothermothrix orenii H 168]